MLHALLKGYARLAIRICCRKIVINRPDCLQQEGPLLLAANHPNSFLDGIIITTLFDAPVYSLARGDAFRNPRVNRILRWLHLLPVYRTSEGTENLAHNYSTFAECHRVFREKGVVLIFSEAGSLNEWRLRPLRKGTARLALSALQDGIPLQVLPLGFNYSPFRLFGKNVWLNFGTPLDLAAVQSEATDGRQLLSFNQQLEAQLRKLVWEIDEQDRAGKKSRLTVPVPAAKKALLALPALAGLLLHLPLYLPVRAAAGRWFNNDHYDSVVNGLLLLAYPLYLLLLFALAATFAGLLPALAVLAAAPFCAWALVQVKPQL
jgi:1-acyl-sn-glycerol-3-phosphate acyltransferase